MEGAETLAYLIEPDVELQRIASTTDHLVAMLADYFKYPSSVSAITDIKRVSHWLKCCFTQVTGALWRSSDRTSGVQDLLNALVGLLGWSYVSTLSSCDKRTSSFKKFLVFIVSLKAFCNLNPILQKSKL